MVSDEMLLFILQNVESIEIEGTIWVNPCISTEQNGENIATTFFEEAEV